MKKADLLKQFYISSIGDLIERAEDIALLDLIYRLLLKEAETH